MAAPRHPSTSALHSIVLVLIVWSAQPAPAGCADQFGRQHDLVVGAYTVVDFAASWCEPCYEALPELQALAAEHPEMRFLVVSVDEEVAGRDRLIEDLDLSLPVIWDEGHELVERFHPRSFPATYVLAPGGEVVHQHVGYSKKKWRRLVEVLARIEMTERVAGRRASAP